MAAPDSAALALMGNHDYGATGSAEPTRFGAPGSPAVRSIELARERLSADNLQWMPERRQEASGMRPNTAGAPGLVG